MAAASKIIVMNKADPPQLTFAASRWRFFTATTLSSLSMGLAVYGLTEWLQIPYGWAVFVVVIRAAFWASTVDIRNFDVRVDGPMLSGPAMLFTSQPATVDLREVEPDCVHECLGVFSVHDFDGKDVMAHYRYYTPDDRVVLRELIRHLRRPATVGSS